jgi:hypothetical protein
MQFIGVTATAFNVIYLEQELKNHCIYHVPKESNYKGISHPDFSMEELQNNFQFKLMKDSETWKLSPDMEEFYSKLLNFDVFESSVREEDEKRGEYWTDHPIICLQKTETTILKQNQWMTSLIEHPRFGKRFVVIVYNGEGVFAYSPHGIPSEIPTSNTVVKGIVSPIDKNGDIIHLDIVQFKTLKIGGILEYFKDYARIKPTHIVIIAGLMVGRGLNICSSDHKWHLTHQILHFIVKQQFDQIVQVLSEQSRIH